MYAFNRSEFDYDASRPTDETWQRYDRLRLKLFKIQREQRRSGAAVQEQTPVDGRSKNAGRAAIPTAPPSTFFARAWKWLKRRPVPDFVVWLMEMFVAVVFAVLMFAAVIFRRGHGLFCDCDRCRCPCCRLPQIECRCQPGEG